MKLTRTVAAAAAVALASVTTGIAGAQEDTVSVSTELGVGSRVLEVTDLAGTDLEALALRPGQPSPFRVAVRDTSAAAIDPNFTLEGYRVDSSLTNLYANVNDSLVYTDAIPSGEVTLGSATSPLDLRDAVAQLQPRYVVGTTKNITCSTINSLLSLSLTTLLSPTCLFLSTLNGSALTFSSVPLVGDLTDVELSTLLPTQLPIVPTGGQHAGEKYTTPDCVNGVGANDTACGGGNGRQLMMLAAAPADSLVTELSNALTGAIPPQLVSLDGTNAKASLDQLMIALLNSGDSDVSTFGNRIAGEFSKSQQVAILNDHLAATLSPLGLQDIVGYGALAAGFPYLRVDPQTPTNGVYTGTLTVRLIDCPECPAS